MSEIPGARDLELLDALDAMQRGEFEGSVWRIVREGRDPLQGSPAGARWDPGTLDVICTSLERDGALAEIHFHLSRQPVFPSGLRSLIHRIKVRASRILRLGDMDILERLGIDRIRYKDLEYGRTQAIGDAAAFLGFDGLIVPSARRRCDNLVLFTDRLDHAALLVEESEPVDWNSWRQSKRSD